MAQQAPICTLLQEHEHDAQTRIFNDGALEHVAGVVNRIFQQPLDKQAKYRRVAGLHAGGLEGLQGAKF